MKRHTCPRLRTEPFAVPDDVIEGFYWNPLIAKLTVIPAAAPTGCEGQASVERIFDRPTEGQPTRLFVLVSTSFRETWDHSMARRADARAAAARRRASAKAHAKRRAHK
jgi:hypothetical protein